MRRLTCLVTAAALALGTAASPAAAEIDRDDVGRIIAGVAILGMLGAIVREERRRDDRETPDRTPPRHDDDWEHPGRRALPAECLRRFETRDGPVRLLAVDCLEDYGRLAARLPLSCAVTVRDRGRFESAFDPWCLQDAGYRIAGH